VLRTKYYQAEQVIGCDVGGACSTQLIDATFNILFRVPERKRTQKAAIHWDNIKMGLQVIGCEDMDSFG
jgi:hypothetical protein